MRMTAIRAQTERKRQDRFARYAENTTAWPEHGGFSAGAVLFQQPARPKKPRGAENACCPARFR